MVTHSYCVRYLGYLILTPLDSRRARNRLGFTALRHTLSRMLGYSVIREHTPACGRVFPYLVTVTSTGRATKAKNGLTDTSTSTSRRTFTIRFVSISLPPVALAAAAV